MEIDHILKEFKRRIAELYSTRLKKVVLYGSYARGEGNEEHSDIDLAVVLEGDISPCEEIDRMIDIITDMNLDHDVLISVYPVSQRDFNEINSPLLLNVRREGVVV
jgi:predicted nucleotidyltransferase